MRREGFELMVGRPEIVTRDVDGKLMEPVEHLTIDVPENFVGTVIERLGPRKGEMVKMHNHGSRPRAPGVPRALPRPHRPAQRDAHRDARHHRDECALRRLHAATRARFRSAPPARSSPTAPAPPPPTRSTACRTAASCWSSPGVEVYEGMIVGEHSRDNDLDVNVVREKKLTNMRASSADEAIRLVPVKALNLEQAIEFIAEDELVEVTPKSLRLRKKILQANRRPRRNAQPVA